jgi:hypothetical protein
MYTILNKNSSVPTAQRKWNTVFDINSNEWKQIYIKNVKNVRATSRNIKKNISIILSIIAVD